MKIAFTDLETSGLDAHGLEGPQDEIIEAAVVLWKDGEIIEQWCQRYMPSGGVPAHVARINGYDEEQWRQTACQFKRHDAHFIADKLAEGGIIGGANPTFDQQFLKAAFRKVRVPWPDKTKLTHRLIDVQSLAIPLVVIGAIKNTSLHELCRFFGLGEVQHSALNDALQAAKCFELLVDGYSRELGAALNGATQ